MTFYFTVITGEPGDPEHRDTHADERSADDTGDGGAVEEDGRVRDKQSNTPSPRPSPPPSP